MFRSEFFPIGSQLILRAGLVRWFSRNMLAEHKQRICIVGTGKQSETVQELLLQHKKLSISLVGKILAPGERLPENNRDMCPLLGTFDDLSKIVEDNGIQQIIIASDNQDHEILLKLGDRCWELGLLVYFVSDLLCRVSRCIHKKEMDIPILPLTPISRGVIGCAGKRIFDLVFSLSIITFTFPVWFAIVIAIKMSSPGPVLYRRKVVGNHGEIYSIYKFRTMYHKNNDKIHEEFMKELITNGSDLETYKITDDPRVTFVGRILRKLSLDELPQFLNVLKGDMSVIGPRQCTIEEFQYYKDWHKRRIEIRPGITGLWQVRARSKVDYDEMVMLDLFYIYHRSWLLDLRIILETIPVMLNGNGAY